MNRSAFASSGGSGLRAVEIKRAYRIEAPGSVERPREGAISPISVDLLDANQRILATHHCFYRRPRPCGCGYGGRRVVPVEREPYLDLIEAIEWPADEVASLSFHRGSEPLATVPVGEPPRVDIEGPERREGSLVVRVRADHPRETPSIAVLFSPDDGVSWGACRLRPARGRIVRGMVAPAGRRTLSVSRGRHGGTARRHRRHRSIRAAAFGAPAPCHHARRSLRHPARPHRTQRAGGHASDSAPSSRRKSAGTRTSPASSAPASISPPNSPKAGTS